MGSMEAGSVEPGAETGGVRTGPAATLVDRLTGETVTVEAGRPAADTLVARIEAADHPRADFRARPLHYDLVDPGGAVIAGDQVIAEGATVELVGPEAAEIVARRNRWLLDIEARGTATTSVSSSTHLALVERTGSRIADVQRLRDQLAAQRRPPPGPPSRWPVGRGGGGSGRAGGRIALIAGLVLVAVVLSAGAWVFLASRGDDVAADGASGAGASGAGSSADDALSLPVELELEVESGTRNTTYFTGSEGDNVVILMLAPAQANRLGRTLDPELTLYDGNGVQIGYNDDRMDRLGVEGAELNGLNSRIDITLPVDGTYEVVSGDLSGQVPGAYRLVIETGGPGGDGFAGFGPDGIEPLIERELRPDEAVTTIAGGGGPAPFDVGCGVRDSVEVSLPYTQSVDTGCEIVVLVFDVPEGGGVIDVTAVSGAADSIVWVLDEAGAELAFDDDGGGSLNSNLAVEVLGGRHEVWVGNLNGEPALIDVTISLS